MTYASDRGLKVGDKIRYLGLGEMFAEHPSYDVGDILILVFDDDSYNPIFRKVDGEVHRYFHFHLHYEWERVEEEKDVKLERAEEYFVTLTGEELALCAAIVGKIMGDVYGIRDSLIYSTYCKLVSATGLPDGVFSDSGMPNSTNPRKFIQAWLDSIFETPETEDERKLRELKEQYEYLGKAIEAMEKK